MVPANGPTLRNGDALRAGKLPGPLLDHLIETYRTRPDPSVLIAAGYGRDAAALDVGAPAPLIVKSDPITFATADAAEYLVAVNGNDIACLGGIPHWLSVVLLLPENQSTASSVEGLFSDLQRVANRAGISVIGGHTEVTSAVTRPVFVGTMLGVAGPHGLLEPGRASPGDDLFLTQSIGLEGTALLAIERGELLSAALGGVLVERAARLLRDPGISVAGDASAVLASGAVTALHDPTEGGVATAIHELAVASGCGALIQRESMPVLPETEAICAHFGIDPMGLISSGALLVAGRRDRRADVLQAAGEAGTPISHIGELTDVAGGVVQIDGERRVTALPRFDADEITNVL